MIINISVEEFKALGLNGVTTAEEVKEPKFYHHLPESFNIKSLSDAKAKLLDVHINMMAATQVYADRYNIGWEEADAATGRDEVLKVLQFLQRYIDDPDSYRIK